MPRKKEYSNRFMLSLNDEQSRAIGDLAGRKGKKKSGVIRDAVDLYVRVDEAKQGLAQHVKGGRR